MVNRQKLVRLWYLNERMKIMRRSLRNTKNCCGSNEKALAKNISDLCSNTTCYIVHAYYHVHRVASADIVNCATDDYYRPYTNAVY